VIVEEQHVLDTLAVTCPHANVAAADVVVFVVDAERPAGATPSAYLHPASYVSEETARVFRAVGSVRADAYHLVSHRIGLWKRYAEASADVLGPLLRHELEHAARWQRSGTVFFEADEELRAVTRGHAAYRTLPTEEEANAGSTEFAQERLTRDAIAAIQVSFITAISSHRPRVPTM
jgi:hypothetical protein